MNTRVYALLHSLLIMFWGLWYTVPFLKNTETADAMPFIDRFNAECVYGLAFVLVGLAASTLAYRGKALATVYFTGSVAWMAAFASIVSFDWAAPGVPIAFFNAVILVYSYFSMRLSAKKKQFAFESIEC